MLKTQVLGKFLGMRKPDEFSVYPYKQGDTLIMVQGDRCIGQFNRETGEGIINYKGSNHKYGQHLLPQLGAEPFTFPMEFVKACVEVQTKRGDTDGTVILSDNL